MSEVRPRTAFRQAPSWAAPLFVRPLVPVIQGPDPAATVWAIGDDRIAGRISEQFKAKAGEYHARYAASPHFEKLFRQALAETGLTVPERPMIFDMGSGSGVNSVVPCFKLFPGARQVASDLSGDLLVMLADHAAANQLADRLTCVVMDAMGGHLAPGRFDLVTGASILHHLAQPALGLQAAARALKPGGQAIFFEPFDGFGLMRLAYQRILAEAQLRADALPPEAEGVMRAMIADIAARTEPDPDAPGFADLDDKWLFSRARLEAMAGDAGFERVQFVAHYSHPTLYRDMAYVQLRLGAGHADLGLPDWANDILDEFDRAMPKAAKALLMLEGTVVLTKAA